MSRNLLILCGASLLILLLTGSSKGQEKDSIKVSKNALIECEFDHAQLEFVSGQLDSVVKIPRITDKDKFIWAGIGAGSMAGIIIILRLLIK